MSARPRPSSVNLEFLRKEAKRLLKACRAGDASAIDRLRAALPRLASVEPERLSEDTTLADVHHAIAREHGCASWATLTRAGDPLERLLVAVRGGALNTLALSLNEFAGLAQESVHAASALGNAEALARHLRDDPSMATTLHRGWTPIVYVCASPVNRLGARYSAGLLECATILLDRGVDPNTTTTSESEMDGLPMPAKYRAIRNQNAALILLLEQRSTGRVRATHEVGLRPFAIDLLRGRHSEWKDVVRDYYQTPEVRQEMMGTIAEWRARNPSVLGHFTPIDLRETHVTPWELAPLPGEVPSWSVPAEIIDSDDALTVAIAYTFPLPLVELMLGRGFPADTRHSNGRSLLAMTVRAGRERVADLLRSHGAFGADVVPRDELIGACMRLDGAKARSIVAAHPGVLASLDAADFDVLAAAARSSMDHLSLMLDVGVPAGGGGTGGVTALHVASWHGRVEAVRTLLDHGASVAARDVIYHGTPLDWAIHGSTHCRTADDDYREVCQAIRERTPGGP